MLLINGEGILEYLPRNKLLFVPTFWLIWSWDSWRLPGRQRDDISWEWVTINKIAQTCRWAPHNLGDQKEASVSLFDPTWFAKGLQESQVRPVQPHSGPESQSTRAQWRSLQSFQENFTLLVLRLLVLWIIWEIQHPSLLCLICAVLTCGKPWRSWFTV